MAVQLEFFVLEIPSLPLRCYIEMKNGNIAGVKGLNFDSDAWMCCSDCSLPKPDEGVNPVIIYTGNLCGADPILALGGVQGITAMVFGLFTGHEADILVGPGNRFVAEAKRILFGRVGIDLFAGPTKIAIITDSSADPAHCCQRSSWSSRAWSGLSLLTDYVGPSIV